MTGLAGRVAIVTGGGRGLGGAYCRFLALHGASVVVNDLGGAVVGGGTDATVAQAVVDEIIAAGGVAVASAHDVSDWSAARQLVLTAVDHFGRLDALVNNAGIARPASLAEMTEDLWDTVVDVHLKGHAAMSCAAMAHLQERAGAGASFDAAVIHTSSVAGLTGVPRTGSYAAAKAGIVGLSKAVAVEGAPIGVRSNVVSPVAHTRLTRATHAVPARPDTEFIPGDPDNVAPLVGWLAGAGCPATAQVFHVVGRQVVVLQTPAVADVVSSAAGRWTLQELDEQLTGRLVDPVRRETMLTELAHPPVGANRKSTN